MRIELGPLDVVAGANGSSKSSLYRTLRHGDVPVQGGARRKPVSLQLGFASDDDGYAIDLGLPIEGTAGMFFRDPEIEAEAAWTGQRLGRSNAFALREGPLVRVRPETGEWRRTADRLAPTDSMMTHGAERPRVRRRRPGGRRRSGPRPPRRRRPFPPDPRRDRRREPLRPRLERRLHRVGEPLAARHEVARPRWAGCPACSQAPSRGADRPPHRPSRGHLESPRG